MFENLTEKFERAFKVLKGQGQISEINVAETLKEVRRALLDADVDFKTAKNFTITICSLYTIKKAFIVKSIANKWTSFCHAIILA